MVGELFRFISVRLLLKKPKKGRELRDGCAYLNINLQDNPESDPQKQIALHFASDNATDLHLSAEEARKKEKLLNTLEPLPPYRFKLLQYRRDRCVFLILCLKCFFGLGLRPKFNVLPVTLDAKQVQQSPLHPATAATEGRRHYLEWTSMPASICHEFGVGSCKSPAPVTCIAWPSLAVHPY